MAWSVKSKSPNGTVTALIEEDFSSAVEVRRDLISKGHEAWIEDSEGKPVDLSPNVEP